MNACVRKNGDMVGGRRFATFFLFFFPVRLSAPSTYAHTANGLVHARTHTLTLTHTHTHTHTHRKHTRALSSCTPARLGPFLLVGVRVWGVVLRNRRGRLEGRGLARVLARGLRVFDGRFEGRLARGRGFGGRSRVAGKGGKRGGGRGGQEGGGEGGAEGMEEMMRG